MEEDTVDDSVFVNRTEEDYALYKEQEISANLQFIEASKNNDQTKDRDEI